jgi:hypothetical protein
VPVAEQGSVQVLLHPAPGAAARDAYADGPLALPVVGSTRMYRSIIARTGASANQGAPDNRRA